MNRRKTYGSSSPTTGMGERTIEEVGEQMRETMHLMMDLYEGELAESGEQEFNFRGEDEAEALGRVYYVRDEFRERGIDAEGEYVGPAEQDGRHIVRLTWGNPPQE